MKEQLETIQKALEDSEQEVAELSRDLVRSQKTQQRMDGMYKQFLIQLVDLLEVSEEDRNNLSLETLLGIVAAKLGKADPTDTVNIEE